MENPCDSNPCADGATCHADIYGYYCACPDFKGGVLCQIRKSRDCCCLAAEFVILLIVVTRIVSCRHVHRQLSFFAHTCQSTYVSIFNLDTTPEILGIDPSFGPLAGGTLITLYGRNLQGDSEIRVLIQNMDCTVLSRFASRHALIHVCIRKFVANFMTTVVL